VFITPLPLSPLPFPERKKRYMVLEVKNRVILEQVDFKRRLS